MRRIKRLVVTCVTVLVGSVVFAAAASACTATYVGPSGGSWGIAANWSTDTVPSNDDVCITGSTEVVFAPYTAPGGSQIYTDSVNTITIAAGATLDIKGESSSYGGDYYQFTQLYVNNSVTVNSGAALLLDSTAVNVAGGGVPAGATSGGDAELFVANDPTSGTSPALVNNGTVTAETDAGTTGFETFIQGPVENAGTLTDAAGTSEMKDDNQVSTNSGTMNVAAGAAALLSGGPGFTNSGTVNATGPVTLTSLSPQTWTQSGGSVLTSTVSLYNGDTLAYDGGTGSFAMSSGGATNALSGTIPAGQTVSLTAGTAGNAIVDLDGAVTNDGTFTLDAPAGATGNPEVDSGPSGGDLVNNATVNFVDPITSQSNLFRADLTNAPGGVLDVQSGTTAFDGGNTMSNQGLIQIAPGAQIIQKGGTTMTNTGTLSPQIASTTSFGMYNLYGGTFNAGGALSPGLVGGYVPAAGQEFEVMNIGNTDTFNGTFPSGGNGFTPDNTRDSMYPGNVGVIYGAAAPGPGASTGGATTSGGTPGSGTAPVPTAVVRVGKTSFTGGRLELSVACPAQHACPRYTVTATVTEHLAGKQVIGLTAIKKATRQVVIATLKGTVAGGRTVTVKLALNRTGVALLKRYGRLKAVVTVTANHKTVTRKTVTLTKPKATGKGKPTAKRV